MKIQARLTCLAVAALPLLGASCSSTKVSKNDPNFAPGLARGAQVAIAETSSKHVGNTARGSAASGAATSGVLTSIIVHAAIASGDRKRTAGQPPAPAADPPTYKAELERACARAAEQALASSGRFNMVPEAGTAREADIHVQFHYAFTAGWEKPLKLMAKWDISSTDGTRRTSYKTSAVTTETFTVLPDSADPRFRDHYVRLAAENARQLVAQIAGQKR